MYNVQVRGMKVYLSRANITTPTIHVFLHVYIFLSRLQEEVKGDTLHLQLLKNLLQSPQNLRLSEDLLV